MFRVAASIGVLLSIGAMQPDPTRVAKTPPHVPNNTESTSDFVPMVSAGESEGESQRTSDATKKKHRNLPPNWREQFAAGQDQTPPQIDRISPHPGGWIVDDIGVDQVQIGFTEAVSVPAGAVSAWKLVGGTVSNFTTSYDGTTNTLTVNFSSAIRDNRLTLIVDYAVTDVASNQLDGEISNPSNPTLPSGDGFRGGQAVFRFNVLQGDANRDGTVNAADGALIQPLLGLCANEPGFNPLADLNLDGCVNTIDAGIYRLGVGHTLPATDGALPFLTTILEPENNSLLRDLFTMRLVFNETMLPARINTRTCFVVDQNGNVIVPQLVALGGFGDIIVYTYNPPLPQCGSYRLGISNALADFSGELLSVPSPPPVISGFVPSPAPTLNAHTTSTKNPTVTITGTAPAAESVEVSGPMGVFTVPVTNPTLGSFTVDFTQHPLADNRVNAIFFTGLSRCDGIRSPPTRTAITRDNQPPTLFIDFPSDGATITTNSTDVAGRVGDVLSGYQGLAVTVNGTPAVVNEGIGTNGTFFASNISLDPSQSNTIQVMAADSLLNSITKQITVTQAPVPSNTRRMEIPTVGGGNGQSSPIHTVLPQPIVVQVFQENGTTPLSGKWITFEVTRSNGRLGLDAASVTPTPTDSDPGSMKFQAQTDAQGKAQASWRLGDDAGEGNNRVRVTATEIAGTVEFCATAEAGPIKQINVGMGNNQIVEVGSPAPEPLIAWMNDACNGNCPVQVTFAVTEGGGIVTGNTSPLPCNDEDPSPPSMFTGQSVTVYTSRTGHAEVRFRAGPNPGNNRITASVAGLNTPATFIVFGVKRDPTKPTSFTGLVVDNGTQPIQGARCDLTINGVLVGTVYTDLNGQFRFDNIPDGESGAAGLTVDGFPATHIGGYPGVDVPPQSYPSLHYETVVIPNAENSLPTPVRLPKMDECNRAYYSQAVDTILTIRRRNPAVADPNAPNYCLPAIDGLRFIVKAGSMSIFGQPAPEGSLLMLNQVHHDDIPMPLPDGAAPPMTGTLWPPYAKFDPPIAVEFPNMVGLPPGAIAYFLSFDHDTSRFEIVASGHVTDDGSLIVTDPGVGIPHGGWHGNCPPYSVTGDCTFCEEGDACCNDRCCQGSPCCRSPDPCCNPNPCCGNSNRCCNPDNPCCGSPDPCCNPSDECCGNPDRCCNPDNPCCKSSDPCCNPNDPCCGGSDACCNLDNPCCIAAVATSETDDSLPTLAVAGPSEPCCDDPDPCCNDPDPCCGIECDDGNPCTNDFCENGECQHPCLGDCAGCGGDNKCFDCGCVSGGCSLSIDSGTVCPGGTVEVELTGSCHPDCGSMSIEWDDPCVDSRTAICPAPGDPCFPIQSVTIVGGSIPCDGQNHKRTVRVTSCPNATPGTFTYRLKGDPPVGPDCTTNGTLTIDILKVVPERTGQETDVVYLLPNDLERFLITPPSDADGALFLAISDPSIAKFRLGQQLASTIQIVGPPITVEIQGLREGETELELRVGSPFGQKVTCIPIKVGGSINLQFDQLPTYTPWRDITATRRIAGQDPFLRKDYQLDNLFHSAVGPMVVPQSTLDALDAVPNAVMSYRVVVRDADGNPMVNKLVVLVHVPEDGYENANRMQVEPLNGDTTNQNGRMFGDIRVANPNGYLEVDIPNWKLLVLVGRAAETFNANPPAFDSQGAVLRNEMSLEDRVGNGHLLMVKREEFGPLEPRVEAALAVRVPHISNHAHAVLSDFFENHLGRVAAPITDSTTFGQEYWRIHDVITLSPLQLNSDLWEPPGIRSVILTEHPKPVPFNLPLYPNDDVSALMLALQVLTYNPDAITLDADVIKVGDPALLSDSVAAQFLLTVALGLTPIVGDGWDVITQTYNFATGSTDASYLVLVIAVVGLSGDLGTFVAAPLGAPANLVAAILKGLVKHIPRPITEGIVRVAGGGIRGIVKFGRYTGRFLTDFVNPSDWIDLTKIRTAYTRVRQQLMVMSDSPIVRHGGLDDNAVSDFVGEGVGILAARGRALTDQAAEGVTSFVRHGNGGTDGAAAMKDLIQKFPANVADDSTESVSTALSKTYRDSPLLHGFDPRGVERANDAVKAARATLHPHLRDLVSPHIGPDKAIKSMEEFEALRFMRAENMTQEQTLAIVAIRNAIPNPVTGTKLQKVIKGTDIDGFIGSNSNISGFVAKQDDAGTAVFNNSDNLIEGLRLDYEPDGFQGQTSVGVIEWDFDTVTMQVDTPRSVEFGGNIANPQYPFVGNGFTATTSGRIVPEYRVPQGTPTVPPEGAKLFQVDQAGNKQLRAVYSNGMWVGI